MPLSPIPLSALTKVGEGLDRPEDVAVGRDGRVFASDIQCAAAELAPDGSFRRLGPASGGAPNGISMDLDGRVLIANFGLHNGCPGPLERLDPDTGVREVLMAEINGRRLDACNYPLIDRAGNIWCSHSTSAESFTKAAREGCDDGFIFVLRPDGSSQIVAEGLAFANGLAMSPDEKWLFCCQSLASNVIRYPVLDGQRLGPGEPYGPRLGEIRTPGGPKVDPRTLGYTDGCGLDVEGNLWVTLFLANKVLAITPDREVVSIIEDGDAGLMMAPTNVTWGGADMKDLYIGSVTSPYVLKTRSPIAGEKLAHQV